MARTIKIKNLQEIYDIYCGQGINAGEYYTLDTDEVTSNKYANDQKVQAHLATDKILINDGASDLTYLLGKAWLENTIQQVILNSPSAFDDKPIVQSSPRPIGTYTYLSAQSDNPLDPSETSGGIKLKYKHIIGQDNANQSFYFDINSIRNETHLNGAYLQWADADLDEVEVEIVCKCSGAAFVTATNTNYKIVSGVLIMTAGDGDISIPDWDLILPVQMVPNEHGVTPAGYWDASYNTTTHKFENYVFNPYGTGEFNIFSEEIEFNCFIPCFPMLKCGQKSIESKDVTRLGHNMRIKALIKTELEDHAWKFCAVVYLYRKHT